MLRAVNPERVIRDLKEMKRMLKGREVIVFGSLIKRAAVERESDVDVAVRGRLKAGERNAVYGRFSKRLYEKHKVILVLHEIREEEWETFLERIGAYRRLTE